MDLTLESRLDPRTWTNYESCLSYFDGEMMQIYQHTPRAYEELFCTKLFLKPGSSIPETCKWTMSARSIGEKGPPMPRSRTPDSERVLVAGGNPGAGPPTAKGDIAKGEVLAKYDAATAMRISRAELQTLAEAATRKDSVATELLKWITDHGRYCNVAGGSMFISPVSLFTSIVQGTCDQTPRPANVGPAHPDDGVHHTKGAYTWDPVILRHKEQHCMESIALKDITVGETLSYASTLGYAFKDNSVLCGPGS